MKFQIVTTEAGYHARIKDAENGETVWTTEVYTEERAARSAIRYLMDHMLNPVTLSFHMGGITASMDGEPYGAKVTVPVEEVEE